MLALFTICDIHLDLMSYCRGVSGPSHSVVQLKQECENLRTLERKELYHNNQTEILDHITHLVLHF